MSKLGTTRKLKTDGLLVCVELESILVPRGSNGWLMKYLIGLCANDLMLVKTVLKVTKNLRMYTRCISNIKTSEAFEEIANG